MMSKNVEELRKESEARYTRQCKKERKPQVFVSSALYGFLRDGSELSVDDLTFAMNQLSNSTFHVSRDLVDAYVRYMTFHDVLDVTREGKYYLVADPSGAWAE